MRNFNEIFKKDVTYDFIKVTKNQCFTFSVEDTFWEIPQEPPSRFRVKLTDKLDLGRGEKSIALSNLAVYYTWKNITKSYNNNKFKISVPTWNDEFELPHESYLISDIQDYF